MADIIYDDEFGARSTEIFGCSFKSITAQMGFNSQPIVFTIVVVEEEDQDFTLSQQDIRSAQSIEFGELYMLGIVQSWERTTTDIGGTGIYTVRLTDMRSALESTKLSNIYIDNPSSNPAFANTNLVYIGSNANETSTAENREENISTSFATVMNRVENTTFVYGTEVFEVDMSALADLTNYGGQGASDFRLEGNIRSLVSAITEFCNFVGAEWWVESRRKSVVDDTIVVTVKVIRRLDGINDPIAITMDQLESLHEDHVVRRRDGFESQSDIVTNKIIFGGVRRKLQEFSGSEIKPFWGFSNNGIPLDNPAFILPDDPSERRQGTVVTQMEQVLNNELDGSMSQDQLAAITKYIDDHWGKKFYVELGLNLMSTIDQNLPNYPEIIPAGWWEGGGQPQGNVAFAPDIALKLQTEDGRWGPFTRLDEVVEVGSGTAESPRRVRWVTWAPVVDNSVNLIQTQGDSYMKCTLDQFGRYVVITMPVALTMYYIDPGTGEIDEERFSRQDELEKIWIPLMDRTVYYGPWTNTVNSPNSQQVTGNTEVSIDRDLVPWVFGERNLSNATAMSRLETLALSKIDTLPQLPSITTGQLEVAGVPAANIGQAIGVGANITEVFIRFDSNGVLTRYTMNLYTRELGEFKRKKQKETEDREERDQKIVEDEFPEIIDDLEQPPEPESAPESQDDLMGPQVDREYVYQKPEGGLGVISVKEGGPFYAVTRLSYADIDPETFAGGLDITGSYFLSEWTNVRNLAEVEASPGLLAVGTRVTVSIFAETENGPQIPYIEQTPQVFSPPPVEE